MEMYKQQSVNVMRHLQYISIYGYVGGRSALSIMTLHVSLKFCLALRLLEPLFWTACGCQSGRCMFA